ncbi:hypothetical protein JCM8097_002496 [Rhodosporidiobolus ruineniae]
MLDRLPVELLRTIVREAAPVTHDYAAYKTRQRTLKHLSRVSRALRPVAQEALGEVVVAHLLEFVHIMGCIKGDVGFLHLITPLCLRNEWHRIAPTLTVLVLRSHTLVPDNAIEYPHELSICKSLRDLSLGLMELDLDNLKNHPHLRRLTLFDCRLSCDGLPPVFASLVELSIRNSEIEDDLDLDRFFSPHHLPALRLLAAIDLRTSSEPDSARFQPTPSAWDRPPFLVTGGDTPAGWPALGSLDPARTLWFLDLEGADGTELDLPYFPPHLYLTAGPFLYDPEGEYEEDLLAQRLSNIGTALARRRVEVESRGITTLVLPAGLGDLEDEGVKDGLERVMRAVDAKRVLWEEGGLESFSAVPEVFFEHERRMAERAQKKQKKHKK